MKFPFASPVALLLVQSAYALIEVCDSADSHLVPSNALPWASGSTPINDSYAGHIVVRDTSDHQAALFYWLFPSEKGDDAPLMIWLQGGPGSSSMIGVFYEMGPLRVQEHKQDETRFTITSNPHSYHKEYNMLFVDQPVGTGYSFVDPPAPTNLTAKATRFYHQEILKGHPHPPKFLNVQNHTRKRDQIPYAGKFETPEDTDFKNGYVVNEEGVAKDFLTFLNEFYARYPSLHKVDLHLASESYGGKYVPAIATAVSTHNKRKGLNEDGKIPLRTLAIGNQWTDPYTQMPTHPAQCEITLSISVSILSGTFVRGSHQPRIDIPAQVPSLETKIAQAQAALLQEDWDLALNKRMEMFDLLKEYSGGVDWYDLRYKNTHLDQHPMNHFLRQKSTRKTLHVAEKFTFGRDDAIFDYLSDDIMMSTKHLFPKLFEEYKVLSYQGNMDLRDGVTSNTAWISTIDWPGQRGMEYSPRKVWTDKDGLLLGYANQHLNLTRVVLVGCGHLVPADEGCPEAALEMMLKHTEEDQFIR